LRYLKPYAKYKAISLHEFSLPVAIHKKFPVYEEFRKLLIARFKKLRFSERSTLPVSLHERLQSLGALDAILSRSTVEDIQMSLELFEIDEQLRANADSHLSSRGIPVEFHLGILRAIYHHIVHLERLLTRHQVGDQRLDPYLSACRAEMVRQVQAVFPLYPVKTPIRDHFGSRSESTDDLVRSVYQTIDKVLLKKGLGRGRKTLAIQLTSAFCSGSQLGSFVASKRARRLTTSAACFSSRALPFISISSEGQLPRKRKNSKNNSCSQDVGTTSASTKENELAAVVDGGTKIPASSM
jgi:hypothetical protein